MADTGAPQDTTTQAHQLSGDLLAELEHAVAGQTPLDGVEPEGALRDQLRELGDHTKVAFKEIVQDYKAKRQALIEQAKATQIEDLKRQLTA